MVIQIHQNSPAASLDDWLEEASGFNENFQSFMLAGHLDHEFYDVDVVMQVITKTTMMKILRISSPQNPSIIISVNAGIFNLKVHEKFN